MSLKAGICVGQHSPSGTELIILVGVLRRLCLTIVIERPVEMTHRYDVLGRVSVAFSISTQNNSAGGCEYV
jgi:hypothetical protein